MSIAKPFTFTPNTYAKSSEVNQDFDVLYSQVNTNISNIAQNATDIDNLESNKANINGSSSQRFAVADPVSDGDAINKGYLLSGDHTFAGDITLSGNTTISGDLEIGGNGSKSIDGQMIYSGQSILSSASLTGSTPLTKTVTLPNDGHTYLVYFSGRCYSTTTTFDTIVLSLSGNVLNGQAYCASAYNPYNTTVPGWGFCIVPLKYGSNNLSIARSSSYSGTATLTAVWYRRVGTNA